MNSSVWLIDGTPRNTTPLGISGPENNANKGVFHWSLITRYSLMSSYTGYSLEGGFLSFCRDAVAHSTAPPADCALYEVCLKGNETKVLLTKT